MRYERALVVGATGGIGSALSAVLKQQGADVTELSRSTQNVDFTNQAAVEAAFCDIEGTFDKLLIAFGILAPDNERPERSLTEIDADAMRKVLDVNVVGTALVLQMLQRLVPSKRRCVIGVLTARIGSIGDNNLGGWYSYRAAKAACNQIVRTAAIEIARNRPQTIVAALHPGTVETSFTKNYPMHAKITPKAAAENLIRVMEGLTPPQNGGFFDQHGKPIPW